MPDIISMIKALKMSWIKIVWNKSNNFTNLVKTCTNITNFRDFLSQKHDMKYTKQKISIFYHEILDNWFELFATSPENSEVILMENLWNNKHILVDKKTVKYLSWMQNNILTLNNLIDQEGNFKLIEDVV